MKRHLSLLIIANIISITVIAGSAQAYWLWTPETKKFINPKYAVKDSPKEQYEWAMSFYNAGDYTRAGTEFDKLVKNYEYSEYAAKSQYYVGLCYENRGKYYTAFENYQKAVDNFPHSENIDEIIAREYNIGNIFMAKVSPKLMGTDIMPPLDRAIDIYKKVVENAPFGRMAPEAQFRMGEALKKSERYDEAIDAFQKIVDDYRDSQFYDKAKYEVAYCAYKSSLRPAYDAAPTEKAVKAFREFTGDNSDIQLSQIAGITIQRLKDKGAEKSFETAKFYEGIKQYQAAVIYYKDILKRYPDSSFTPEARIKIEILENRLEQMSARDTRRWSLKFF
jgi:outer membrane protein assembly factor BamD